MSTWRPSLLIGLLAITSLSAGIEARANLKAYKLSTSTQLTAPRWMYDPAQTVEGSALAKKMAAMRGFANEKKWSQCVAQYPSLAKLAPSLKPWIARQRLICAQGFATAPAQRQTLENATDLVTANSAWLVGSAFSDPLKTTWLEAMVQLLDLQVKSSRKAAWKTFETLQQYQTELTPEQASQVFQFGGELAFVEQNLKKALGFFERSYEAKASKEVMDRLVAIRSKLLGEVATDSKTSDGTTPDMSVFLGEEEQEIFERMQKALKSKDYVAAVEDGIKLIVKYPGGSASDQAEDQILRIYLTVAGEKRDDFRLLKQRIVKQMREADADRLLRWATNAYWRGHYIDGLDLGEEAGRKYEGQEEAAKAFYIAAKSAFYLGENPPALKHFKTLVEKFAGTEQAEEALFLMGLLSLRQQQFSEAAAHFERLLAVSKNEKWTYRGLYWYWRSLQKTSKERSVEVALRLENEFPLTYYGLRARAELNGNRLVWPAPTSTEAAKASVGASEEFWFSNNEKIGWDRFQLLLKAGWFDEAQAELSALPTPYTPTAQMVMAHLWGRAMNHHKAIILANQAWDEDPTLRTKDLISIVFPHEFKHLVSKETKSSSVDAYFVYALIRQESSFRAEALSPSGARGLMQLMIPTAKDMLRPRELKTFTPEDLFRPELNIRLGVRYIDRLSRSFKGHLPLTLAAYNAGIGRMQRWMANRKETEDLRSQLSSDPMSEIWVDELPWDETSDYVKSVLRNYLIYQMLETGELALKDPLWLPSGS